MLIILRICAIHIIIYLHAASRLFAHSGYVLRRRILGRRPIIIVFICAVAHRTKQNRTEKLKELIVIAMDREDRTRAAILSHQNRIDQRGVMWQVVCKCVLYVCKTVKMGAFETAL